MELYWQDTNITNVVRIVGCVHRDVSHGKSDCLELTMDHAAQWYRWGPKTGDEIRIRENGYDTGTMYLNTFRPSGDRFKVLATSLPASANRKAWKTYQDRSFGDLLHESATECGMKDELYGAEAGYRYPFMMRKNEGAAAFMERLSVLEGVALKTVGKAMRGIGILWAQDRTPVLQIEVTTDMGGITWTRRDNEKWAGVTAVTTTGSVTARDTDVKDGHTKEICLPVDDLFIAARWARGILLDHNRKAETLTMEMGLNLRFGAMERVNITGSTGMTGEWIVDEAEHDLIAKTTRVQLLRVIRNIR